MPRTAEFTKLSSHVIGSDHVGKKVTVQPDAPIEGIYGSSGFYFQQRRGRLDLRSLAQIDLEKVVRDVDIDVLQMSLENICFCNLREEDLRFITDQHVVKIFRAAQLVIEYLLYAQEQLADNCNVLSNKYSAKKRAVMKKRKELMELQENSKVLRSQLRAKKKSVKTLEQLLRDASRNRRREPMEEKPTPEPKPSPLRPAVLRFFVSNSNGLCVEFNLRPNTFVYELLKEVKQAFVSRRDREDHSNPKKSAARDIQLIYQGKVLLEGHTLEESDIQPNDTIIAVIPSQQEEKEEKLPQADDSEERNRREELARQKQMMDFFAKQQEMMKENWALLIGKLNMPVAEGKHSSNLDQLELQAKLASMEASMQQRMHAELELLRGAMGNNVQHRFVVGELEDDDDELRRELERKIALSNKRLREMEDKLQGSDQTVAELRKLQMAQQLELEELRRLLREFHREPVVQPAPAPAPAPAPVVAVKVPVDTGGRKEVKTKPGKWNDFALVGKSAEPIVQSKVSKVVEEVVEPPPVRAPEPVKEKPVVVPKSRPPVSRVQAKTPARVVTIVFPRERLTALVNVPGLWGSAVEVTVMDDISPDDLIFEIRRVFAEKAKVPLACVSLSLKGLDVFLAVDIPPGVQLTATSAPELIRRGDLIVEVRHVVTDAQLDTLSSQMENSDNEYLSGDNKTRKSLDASMSLRRSYASNSESETEQAYTDTLRRYSKVVGPASPEGNPDSDSDSDAGAEIDEDNILDRFRDSLTSTLIDVDDAKGLTDEEFDQKMKTLKSSLEVLPRRMSRNLSEHKGSVPGIVSAAIDSGSEEYQSSDNDRSRGGRSSRQRSLRLAPEGMLDRTLHQGAHSSTMGGQVEGIGLRGDGNNKSERRLFSSSLTLSRGSGSGGRGRQLRDYDSADDNEPVFKNTPPTGNLSSSAFGMIPRKASPQSRYSSARDDTPDDDDNDDEPPDDSDDNEEEEDRQAQQYLQQYAREEEARQSIASLASSMTSTGTAEEKRDYLSSRAAAAGNSRRDVPSSSRQAERNTEDFDDTSSTGSGLREVGSAVQSRMSTSDLKDENHFLSTGGSFDFADEDEGDDDDGRHHHQLSTTVNTDISMPDTHTESFDIEESVNERADEYERNVQRGGGGHKHASSSFRPPLDSQNSGAGIHTPNSLSRKSSGANQQQMYNSKYSNDATSPFDQLHSDFDDDLDPQEDSLDLSQSADAFGTGTNLDFSSFSKHR